MDIAPDGVQKSGIVVKYVSLSHQQIQRQHRRIEVF